MNKRERAIRSSEEFAIRRIPGFTEEFRVSEPQMASREGVQSGPQKQEVKPNKSTQPDVQPLEVTRPLLTQRARNAMRWTR